MTKECDSCGSLFWTGERNRIGFCEQLQRQIADARHVSAMDFAWRIGPPPSDCPGWTDHAAARVRGLDNLMKLYPELRWDEVIEAHKARSEKCG